MSAGNEVLAQLPWSVQVLAGEPVNAATDRALERETLFIELAARRHSDADRMLADDLEQAARISLWDVDSARFTPSETGYVRRTMLTAIKEAKYYDWRDGGGKYRVQVHDRGDEDEPLEENDYQGMLARAYENGEAFDMRRREERYGWGDPVSAREALRQRRALKRKRAARRKRAESEPREASKA